MAEPSYLNFDKSKYAWRPDVDYCEHPELYRVGGDPLDEATVAGTCEGPGGGPEPCLPDGPEQRSVGHRGISSRGRMGRQSPIEIRSADAPFNTPRACSWRVDFPGNY